MRIVDENDFKAWLETPPAISPEQISAYHASLNQLRRLEDAVADLAARVERLEAQRH